MTKTMSEQAIENVVAAILDGKYSWACVLLLEAVGYDPLDYIPRRTYNRIHRDHNQQKQQAKKVSDSSKNTVQRVLSQIEFMDPYVRDSRNITGQGRGGVFPFQKSRLSRVLFRKGRAKLAPNPRRK